MYYGSVVSPTQEPVRQFATSQHISNKPETSESHLNNQQPNRAQSPQRTHFIDQQEEVDHPVSALINKSPLFLDGQAIHVNFNRAGHSCKKKLTSLLFLQ